MFESHAHQTVVYSTQAVRDALNDPNHVHRARVAVARALFHLTRRDVVLFVVGSPDAETEQDSREHDPQWVTIPSPVPFYAAKYDDRSRGGPCNIHFTTPEEF